VGREDGSRQVGDF